MVSAKKHCFVIPAKAGIHLDLKGGFVTSKWIPAFAGMTDKLRIFLTLILSFFA